MSTATTKKKTAPKPTSDRKRPNKAFIEKMAQFRGFTTGNEKSQLSGLEVKNALQRVNNRAMSEDVNINFTGAENTELQRLMKEFTRGVNAVLKAK